MMTTKSKLPQIRFKGFSGEWEKNRLKELTEILRCGIAATPQYVDDGVVFLSSQNVTNSGKINLEKFNYISEEYYKKISKNAKLLKGDILYTRVGAGFGNSTVFPYDGDYGVYVSLTHIRTNKNLNNKFLNHLLNSPICKEQAENGVFQGGGVPNLNVKIVENFNIVYPKTENEQIKIGDYFQQLDKLLEQKEKKYQKLKQFKKAMLDKMFPKNGADTPEIRFKGFSGKWEEKKLGEFAKFRRGSFPQPYGKKEWYDGESAMPFVQVVDVNSNLSLNKDTKQKISLLAQPQSVLVKKGTVVVTLQGSIGRVAILQYDAYVDRTLLIFESFETQINSIYWAYLIQKLFEQEKKKAPGGTIKTITKEALSNFTVLIPILEEQEKIGNHFQKLDIQIDLQQKELEKLKNIKKASLSKMFV